MRRRRKNSPEIEAKLSSHGEWLSSYFRRGQRADFSGYDLSKADLQDLDLSGARLQNADLSDARLVDTIFHGANLRGADLSRATVFDTVFRRVDLSEVRGLETLVHHGPSTIGVDTLLRSRGAIPSNFLVGTGVPPDAVETLLAWAREHGTRASYESVFVSFGGPDEGFARQISQALKSAGVHTFFFPDDAQPGWRLHEVMSRFVNEFGRIVLICSKSSLARNGVINELDEALRREAREGASDRLIPIALDDYVYSEWTPEREGLARAIRDKVIVDFRDVELDSQEFEAGIARLLGSLRREEPI